LLAARYHEKTKEKLVTLLLKNEKNGLTNAKKQVDSFLDQ